MFVLDNGVRSDFLALFLTWTDLVASFLNVSIPPVIPVTTFLLSYSYSEVLVATFASESMQTAVQELANAMYVRNLVSHSPTGMNLWTRYRLTTEEPPFWFVATQLMWFIVPCVGITAFLVVCKVVSVAVWGLNGVPFDASDVNVPAEKLRTVTTVPLNFLDHFLPESDRMRGVMAVRPAAFRFDKDAFEVDRSNLWLAGWIIFDKQFLVCVDDLPNIFLNVMANATLVKIYCCSVVTDGSTGRQFLKPRLIPLRTSDVTLWSLAWLRLNTLWVKTVKAGGNQATLSRLSASSRKSYGSYSTICLWKTFHAALSVCSDGRSDSLRQTFV
jgi:hypothetical protein